MLLTLALPAYAVTARQQKEINDLNKQLFETKQKLIDKYVESGQLTADRAKLIKEKMAKRFEIQQKNGFKPFFGKKGGKGKCPYAPRKDQQPSKQSFGPTVYNSL